MPTSSRCLFGIMKMCSLLGLELRTSAKEFSWQCVGCVGAYNRRQRPRCIGPEDEVDRLRLRDQLLLQEGTL